MKTRDTIAYEEATRDPVFLFQYKEIRVINLPDNIVYSSELCAFVDTDNKRHNKEISKKELLEHDNNGYPCAVILWHTERVFATREEGDIYGKQRHYNFPEGWRVYCVPAEGLLFGSGMSVSYTLDHADMMTFFFT